MSATTIALSSHMQKKNSTHSLANGPCTRSALRGFDTKTPPPALFCGRFLAQTLPYFRGSFFDRLKSFFVVCRNYRDHCGEKCERIRNLDTCLQQAKSFYLRNMKILGSQKQTRTSDSLPPQLPLQHPPGVRALSAPSSFSEMVAREGGGKSAAQQLRVQSQLLSPPPMLCDIVPPTYFGALHHHLSHWGDLVSSFDRGCTCEESLESIAGSRVFVQQGCRCCCFTPNSSPVSSEAACVCMRKRYPNLS